VLDSTAPKADVADLMAVEPRFQATAQHDSEEYTALAGRARHHTAKRLSLYRELSQRSDSLSAPDAH
jgi:hypothetical protein